MESVKQRVLAVYPDAEVQWAEKSRRYAISLGGWHKWDGNDYYDYITGWWNTEDAAWIDAHSLIPSPPEPEPTVE